VTRLYTVGYQGRSLAELLDSLSRAEVQRVVDVRELPLSRKPGFSKTALAAALAERGIEYVHVKPLGNPKANRERYWRAPSTKRPPASCASSATTSCATAR
jgi:uncharacterized protein (DUF488 family)